MDSLKPLVCAHVRARECVCVGGGGIWQYLQTIVSFLLRPLSRVSTLMSINTRSMTFMTVTGVVVRLTTPLRAVQRMYRRYKGIPRWVVQCMYCSSDYG